MTLQVDKRQVAELLRQYADILEQQHADQFRVAAYRRAADTIGGLPQDIIAMYNTGGVAAFTALPYVGARIAGAIQEIITTGSWKALERMRGSLSPADLFDTIPSIGPKLAHEIYDHLHIDSLEALEIAAHDGSLETVPGMGPRRSEIIRAELEHILKNSGFSRAATSGRPAVSTLLEIDREYRARAKRGLLPTIAPRRFNPRREAWLPVLHTERGEWHFTALYSNTARAHRLRKTHNWVVVFYNEDHHQEGQCTVVTEKFGPLAGKRVVRGRELECQEVYYDQECKVANM